MSTRMILRLAESHSSWQIAEYVREGYSPAEGAQLLQELADRLPLFSRGYRVLSRAAELL